MEFSAKIAPCLWFDNEAEEAANLYTSIFPNSRIRHISRYAEAGKEIHGKAPGSVMTVEFELAGLPFTALNGGPVFEFNESVSFQVFCDDQEELDRVWDRLLEGGKPQQCGWLKDRFGVSWQVVPSIMGKLMTEGTPEQMNRMMGALMPMVKLDIEALEKAYHG